MQIPSSVLRATPEALRTPLSESFMGAYNSSAVQKLCSASTQIDKALASSAGGWGAAPQAQVGRAIDTLATLPSLQSAAARDQATFASEVLRNTLAGRRGNAPEVINFRRAALQQARGAVNGAAQAETTLRVTGRIQPPHALTL